MPLTEKQLATLAQVRTTGMHYLPGVTAILAGDGAPTKLHLASVRRLVDDGHVEVHDDDIWRISATGEAALEGHSHHIANAGLQDAIRQGEAVVTEMWRAKLVRQHTGDEEDRILAELTDTLRRLGSVQIDIADATVPPVEWRRIARIAARSLGRPVQTLMAYDQLVAILMDWPASAEERRIHDARLRAAVNGAAD